MARKEPAPWIRRLNCFLEAHNLEQDSNETLWACARRMNESGIAVIEDIDDKSYKRLKDEICFIVKNWKNATNPEQFTKGTKKPNKKSKKKAKSNKGRDDFYKSWAWKKLRFEVLKHYGTKCMLCGSEQYICVDHIYPRKKYPHLEMEFDNMQVLCRDCNMGKNNDDFTDFRRG